MDFNNIKRLMATVLPVFILTFIMTYLSYAPNIYLGEFRDSETVAIYAILITPAALFQVLLHTLFFGAPLPHTSEAYASGQLKRFSKRIHVLLLLVVATALPFMAVTYFLGITLLSWLYSTDFSPYLKQLMLISTGGLFTTTAPIIGMALIIMRKQKAYMYSFISVGMVSGPLVGFLVWQYGLDGAVLSNLIIFAPLTVLAYIVFRRLLYKEIASTGLNSPKPLSVKQN
jgi:O-antigen/teichoic acid export membrane protein